MYIVVSINLDCTLKTTLYVLRLPIGQFMSHVMSLVSGGSSPGSPRGEIWGLGGRGPDLDQTEEGVVGEVHSEEA